jgi:hypothetical protein
MPIPPILPKGEGLRRAIAWLSDQRCWTPDMIEQASRRFDLSPLDEEFLLRESPIFHARDVKPR